MAQRVLKTGTIVQSMMNGIPKGGGVFTSLYRDAVSGMDMNKVASVLEEFAKEGHKSTSGTHYKNRTRDLVNNTYAVYNEEKYGGIAIGVDDSKVRNSNDKRYSQYVRFGTPSNGWEGDDFIDETIRNKSLLVDIMQKEVNKSVVRTNGKTNTIFVNIDGVTTAFRVLGSTFRFIRNALK